MTRPFLLILVSVVAALGTRAWAADPCRTHFEVAGATGAPIATTRATRTSDAGTCNFAVRLQSDSGDGCAAFAEVRGLDLGKGSVADWRHVTLRQRGRHVKSRKLRARVGGGRAARLTLRCAPPPALDGCDDVLAESTYCFLGGGRRVRVVGLASGSVCRSSPEDTTDPASALQSSDLAVWNGDAYTCSVAGAFVATPVDGGDSRRVAGPCLATTTDGDALLVRPAASGFDPSEKDAPAQMLVREDLAIRAYDVPESVPGGPFRVAFDLTTIPANSPCAGRSFDVITARDGIIYAAGCSADGAFGTCDVIDDTICIFDTHTGTVLAPIQLDGFDGAIRGLSAIGGGRLVVLTNDQTPVPPTGYFPPGSDGQSPGDGMPRDVRRRRGKGIPAAGGSDSVQIFDAATGARLDSRTIATTNALGLACVSRGE